jgi:prepilin-type N-terminal cleavage/methylation domain-containing protein
MSALRRLAARLSPERGHTLIELLTVMMILGTVLTGLTSLFVSASAAQADLSERHRAQQTARLALERLRREVHCANAASTTGSAVTLTLGNYCRTGQGDFTWCTVSLGTLRWGLYRKAGTTCNATGTKLADYITAATIFAYVPPSAEMRARLSVDLPVDVRPGSAAAYRLQDAFVLRNTLRVDP